MTRIVRFRDDDDGYLAWLAGHPEGYLVNISHSSNVGQARLHRAACHTIRGRTDAKGRWTKQYDKLCAEELAELEQWAIETLRQPITPCGTCRPPSGAAGPASSMPAEPAADGGSYFQHGLVARDNAAHFVHNAGISPLADSSRISAHPRHCLWDGLEDQSDSDWDSVVDWARWHHSAWRRWQLLTENLNLESTAAWVEIMWNSALDHPDQPASQLAYVVRCVALLRDLSSEFDDHPELRELFNRLTSELAQRWRGGRVSLPTTSANFATAQVQAASLFEVHSHIHEPVVEAWAAEYVRFDNRPDWQESLRDEIRNRCSQLLPSAGQVLHATYFGEKLPNADVENLVLYNIDSSFKAPGANGIRFEHGTGLPPAPDEAEYRFCYRYALAPRSPSFAYWRQKRVLAAFNCVDDG